jgi:hypothetical protein
METNTIVSKLYRERKTFGHDSEDSPNTNLLSNSTLPINPSTVNSISNICRTRATKANMISQGNRVGEICSTEKASLESDLASKLSVTGALTSAEAVLSSSLLITLQILPPNSKLEIRNTPGKGYGIFSTAPIARGTRLLAEEPLLRINHTQYMAKDVQHALEKLPKEKQTRYWTLASAHGQDASRSVQSLLQKRRMLVDVLKLK